MKTISASPRHLDLARVGIFLVAAALIAGTAGCSRYPYTLTISSTEGGEVTSPGEGRFGYNEVTEVTIVADAYEGHRFIGWTGDTHTVDDVNTAATTITVNDDYSITAEFCPETSGNLAIGTWYDLAALRCNLAGNHTLMNDLDSATPGYSELAGSTANEGKGWQPIGTDDDPFTGTLDGQGFEIRGLFINRADEWHVGLFGYVEGGQVKDVGVVDACVVGGLGTGALAGFNTGTVTNSYATGSIAGLSVGGLAGENYGTVSYCYSTGSVAGDAYVGCLVGGNGYDAVISNSYSTGNATGGEIVGGLVGLNEGGSVSNSYSAGSADGVAFVGGLVGMNAGNGNVSESYSIDSVTGNMAVGGLVGHNGGGTVTNCYSAGSVAGNDEVGGLVGRDLYPRVVNSFWDTETSGRATSAGGTGKTTAEMQDITTFSGATWNITAVANPGIRDTSCIWNIVDDETYPFLSWHS